MLMLFVIPVLALVRTTVDSEGTAAITENSEKDESGTLVRHTETETADPWDKWAIKPYWFNAEWVTEQGWTKIDGDQPLVGIKGAGWGKSPPGMQGTALASQEFIYKFACDETGQEWEIAWKTHWANGMDPNGKPYAKDLAGNGLHVFYEKQGRVERPPDSKSLHVRTGGVFPKEYTAWPSTGNVFNCPGKLTTKISQYVTEYTEDGPVPDYAHSGFTFGEGVATNVQTQPGSQVLVLGFTQNCKEHSGGSKLVKKVDISNAPNCFTGKRGALLMHLSASDVANPTESNARPLEMDRVVMYVSEN